MLFFPNIPAKILSIPGTANNPTLLGENRGIPSGSKKELFYKWFESSIRRPGRRSDQVRRGMKPKAALAKHRDAPATASQQKLVVSNLTIDLNMGTTIEWK